MRGTTAAPAFVRRLRAANEATTPGFIPLLKKKFNFLRYFFFLLLELRDMTMFILHKVGLHCPEDDQTTTRLWL